MKIIHASGKELKLKPGTVLEMERANPFFNDYGEQSLPVKLPPDEYNRSVLGFPDDLAGVNKMPNRSDATIQEGIFSIRCRQAILSASQKDGIDTSFYLNIGSFYEKMKDVQLVTVFKDKVLKFQSVTSAVSFVRSLMITPDSRFSCFPILAESHESGEIICLNKVSGPIKPDGYYSLFNEQYREEIIDEKTVSTPAGYFITPLIKAVHLLEETFKYLGYTLEDNFFSKTEPFRSMVFLNNNIDSIVNAEIRYDQLVPNCNISTLETEKKESSDTLVGIEFETLSSGVAPFIGTTRAVNSKIIWDNKPTQGGSEEDSTQKKSELNPMLCFTAHRTSRFDSGTIYAYLDTRERIWNYSLAYNGPDGLYEKFWRKYDDMLRNSMRPVTTKMLLKDVDKLNISAYEKVLINNQEVLPNVIKYNIGKNVDTECTFLTTKLYNPISSAKLESTHFPSSKYQWRMKWSKSVSDQYNWMQLKEQPITLFFPPPTEAEYSRGGRYHEKSYPCWFAVQVELIGRPVLVDKISGTLTTWLEPILREW